MSRTSLEKLADTSSYLETLKRRKLTEESNCCENTLINFKDDTGIKLLLNLKKVKVSNETSISKLKIERMLMLKHSYLCTSNECPHKWCKYMKTFLIRHCKECSNEKCQIPFCKSTRLIVNHYGACKNKCQICQTFNMICSNHK
tara:strand:- start:20 stop:451 length:432 start_codon:yes stop_codon:yes gene_type:complete